MSVDKFNWIKTHFSIRQDNSWNRVSDIVPNIFDEYFFIHWKVGMVYNFSFDQYPEQNGAVEETIDQTNNRIKIEREFGLFLNSDSDKLFREISLKEISEKFKAPYNYNLLNIIKQTPAIQILKRKSKDSLKLGLERIAKNQVLNLFVQDINRYPIDDNPKQEYAGIDIGEYLELQEDFNYDYCSYLFPEDLSWCLTTSEDLPMFLCIKKEPSGNIINEFNLELFRVEYDADLY